MAEEKEKKKSNAGRPPGATNKSLSKAEFEKLIMNNSKEAITRLISMMRSESEGLSYRACVKVLEMAKELPSWTEKLEAEYQEAKEEKTTSNVVKLTHK